MELQATTGKVLSKRPKCFWREECNFPNSVCHISYSLSYKSVQWGESPLAA